MSDITLLGLVCLGLGAYCLYLHSQMRAMQKVGLLLTDMMVNYVVDTEDCSLVEATKIIQKLFIRTMTRGKMRSAEEEA